MLINKYMYCCADVHS